MPQSRKSQVSLIDTPYYHCVSRCVRRSFLCGEDKLTGQSYEHRRGWVEDRLLLLSSVFAIDICAYAVMSNHTHIVLHVDKALALSWSVDEVLSRYHRVYKGTLITQKYSRGVTLSEGEQRMLTDVVETYRARLYNLSWFMRNLNESIAREANKEDHCTGRFWEGRFKSQALLDEQALLSCMAYVDLNPIRAKLAKTPEGSDYTSIRQRTQALTQNRPQPTPLMPFVGNPKADVPTGIPYNLMDYLELVDTTGRYIRQDKAGYIETSQSPILTRLGLDAQQWLTLTTEFEQHFCYAVGSEQVMKRFGYHTGHQRVRGIGKARTLLKCA